MVEIRNSDILDILLTKAKTIGENPNNPLSAERFLVALIDLSQSKAGDADTDPELILAESILGAHIGLSNFAGFKKLLMEHILQNKENNFLDTLYLNKKLYEAKANAEKKNADRLLATGLLECILEDPSKTIGDALDRFIDEGVPEYDVKDFEKITFGDDNAASPSESETASAQPAESSDLSALVAKVKEIRAELRGTVYGQDNAINVFSTGFFRASLLSMTDKGRKRPRATFLFAGPPGVGKTFLAEKAAQILKLPFMRFDMSEYSDKEACVEFCGADNVYKGAKPGNVTGFVAQNPKCVLLFDEIEKAHISVIHLFLQLLDAGRLRDNHTDEEVSFSDTIIILTTNAGKQLYEESESEDLSNVSRKVVIKALQKDVNPETRIPYFPAAICSRFASGNVVMFNHIRANDLRAIAKKEIERNAKNIEAESGIRISIDDSVYTALLFSEGSNADARTVRSRAETFLSDELYELFRLISSEKVKTNIENIENIEIGIDLSQMNEDIRAFFMPVEKPRVLVFADKEMLEKCKEKSDRVEMIGAEALPEAMDALKKGEIDFALLDMSHGARDNSVSLNIEDVESPARDLFKLIRTQRNEIPIYLLESKENEISEEERVSFMRQGVRGIFVLSDADNCFSSRIEDAASALHQQSSMEKLAAANKLISFESSQTVSEDGKRAMITLFDFKQEVAVDSEDAKNVLSSLSRPNVRFDDIIGGDEAKKELMYFVEYLKNPKKYIGTGVKAPKGVLLYGPPGTGKTMLAKAMASEAGVTFIASEGNEFLKKYVGEGSERVHELFKTARKYAPSVLFIDEIDAIAKERRGSGAESSASEATLTAFLTEMDGFINDPSKPVFVLAATNFDVQPGGAKSLDGALMRRFDRRVYIDLPRKDDRIRFLKMKAEKNTALDISEAQIENIAVRSTGMSLAELDSVVELALRSAIREGSTKVTDPILEEAFETFNGGEVKKWDSSQLQRIARHEAGHAFICHMNGETPSYLTIVARGNHGGYMQHGDNEGKAIYTRDELLARIRTSLGGRAAELVYYGEHDGISSGASGDLASATNVALRMACNYGMVEDFGLAVVNESAINGSMSSEIRQCVNRILKEQLAEAVRIISENRDRVDALVDELMQKNHLSGAEIESVLKL